MATRFRIAFLFLAPFLNGSLSAARMYAYSDAGTWGTVSSWLQTVTATLPMSSETAYENWTWQDTHVSFTLLLPGIWLPPGSRVESAKVSVYGFSDYGAGAVPTITVTPVQETCDGVPCPFSPGGGGGFRTWIDFAFDGAWVGGVGFPVSHGGIIYLPGITATALESPLAVYGGWSSTIVNPNPWPIQPGFNSVTNTLWLAEDPVFAYADLTVVYDTVPEPGTVALVSCGFTLLAIASFRQSRRAVRPPDELVIKIQFQRGHA